MGFEDCPGAHVLSHDFWEFRMSWHLKTPVVWVCRMGELLLRPVGGGRPDESGGYRRRLDALHEGGALLDEGWGYFG